MMTDNELDNLFKNTFGNHEAPVPVDMWQRIQPNDKKRRVIIWWKWYIAAAVFLTAGAAMWWFGGTTPQKKAYATYNTINKKDSSTQTIQNNSATDSINTVLQKEKIVNNNTQANDSDSSSNKLEGSLLTAKKSKTGKNNKQFIRNKRIKSHQENAAVTKDAALTQQHAIAVTKQNNLPAINSANGNSPNAFQAPVTSNLSTTEKVNNTTTNPAVALQNVSANNNANKAPSTPANTSKEEAQKSKLPWTIEFYATTAFADKKTYGIVKENIPSMAALISPPQPKPSLWNYNAGVRIGIPVSKKIIIKTGVQFEITRQQQDYQQQNVVDMVAINGFADTSRYRQIIYETEKQQSTYNALNVPVLLSYQTGKKIQVAATAGLIINAYSWYSGKVPNSNYSATLAAKETYKHNTGVALYAGVSASKKVGAVQIFAEPHLQYSLSSISKPSLPFKQKINTYGLSLGIRTTLHK